MTFVPLQVQYFHMPRKRQISYEYVFYPIGSNVIVAGTAIFHDAEPDKVIQVLKDAVNTAQSKWPAREEL